MILAFDKMEEKTIEHMKGGDGAVRAAVRDDGLNRILRARLPQGASIGMHTHEDSSEIIYVLAGTARIECDGQEEILTAGMAHYCPRGHAHATHNDRAEELVIFAVVPRQ